MKKILVLFLFLISTLLIAEDSFGCKVAVKQYDRQKKEMERASAIKARQQFKASCFWAISSLKDIYIKCDDWDTVTLDKVQVALKHYEKIHDEMVKEDGY